MPRIIFINYNKTDTVLLLRESEISTGEKGCFCKIYATAILLFLVV